MTINNPKLYIKKHGSEETKKEMERNCELLIKERKERTPETEQNGGKHFLQH
jgi:hypothetical protein